MLVLCAHDYNGSYFIEKYVYTAANLDLISISHWEALGMWIRDFR